MDGGWEDKEMSREHDKRAVKRLINDLQRNIQQYLTEKHNAIDCEYFKDKILDIEITEKDIKDWMVQNKLRRINNDFE